MPQGRFLVAACLVPCLALLSQTTGSGPDEAADQALNRGDYTQATRLAGEAYDRYRKSGDRAGQARALNQLGLAELYLGNYEKALDFYHRALELDRLLGDTEGEVVRLYNVGNVFYFQGRYQDAHRRYLEALERLDSAAGEAWSARRRQIATANLANLYQRLGQHERALELYGKLRATPGLLNANEEARLLANLGTLYRRLGDPQKALDTYGEARRLFAQERHLDGEIGVLKNIGIALAVDLGEFGRALGAFRAALRLAEASSNAQVAQSRLYIGETLRRMAQLGEAGREFEKALEGARQLGGVEDEWRALYGLGRIQEQEGARRQALARYQEAIARIEQVRSQLEMLALKREFLADKREVYEAAIDLLLDSPPYSPGQFFALMEQSRGRILQDRLSAAPLEAVQSRLDNSTLLVEYFQGARNGAVLYVTARSAELARIPPVEATPLREMGKADEGTGWRQPSAALGRTLLGPLTPLRDAGIRHLLIVPDGPLELIPFDLLRLPRELDAAEPLLVERAAVSYLPTAAAVLRPGWGSDPGLLPPWRPVVLAVADPALEDDELSRLPRSVEEAETAASLLGGRSDVFAGERALKKHLEAASTSRFQVLHISTHATADLRDPEKSRILFTPAHAGEQHDSLYLREVYGLRLPEVHLVTLAACDTETGKWIPGEGVESFGRAFLAAGTRSAVSTLWRVADEPTAELMKQFYYWLGEGLPKAEALRRAKLRFLESGSQLAHPRYWAAFVLSGDGLAPAPRAWRWAWAPAGAAILLLLAAGLAWRLRRRAPTSERRW